MRRGADVWETKLFVAARLGLARRLRQRRSFIKDASAGRIALRESGRTVVKSANPPSGWLACIAHLFSFSDYVG